VTQAQTADVNAPTDECVSSHVFHTHHELDAYSPITALLHSTMLSNHCHYQSM